MSRLTEYRPENFLDNYRADKPLGLPKEYRCTHWVLPVRFDNKGFNLPLVTVNPRVAIKERISIAWLDCREKGLGEAIGRDLGRLVAPLVDENTVLFTPPSKKSIGMATQVLATAIQSTRNQNLELVKIQGCKTAELERFFELQSDQIDRVADMQLWHAMGDHGDRFGVNYTPVTGTRKSMWLGVSEQERLTGKRVIAIDDVATTRATINAWELLLSQECRGKEEYVATAAIEGDFQMEANHLALIRLPEIHGPIDMGMFGK